MGILDIFKRESVHISADKVLIIPGDESRKVICYKCDRELGEDHDDERCARKGSTRRVFFGRMAATAASAAVLAKVAPGLLNEVSTSSKPVQEIAAEAGLFGEKTKELLSGIAIARQGRPFAGYIVRRGDIVEFGPGVNKVVLGYQYENIPIHPLMPRSAQQPRGYTETFIPKNRKMTIPHDMQIFTAYDADRDVRVALTIIRPEEADAIKGGVLIGAATEKPLTDLESYIEKRKSEGVTFDETWTLKGRDKIREREGWKSSYDMIEPTPMAMAAAATGTVNYRTHYHPSMQRRLSLEKPLAKPKGYLPA